jgi:23S rRNA pseudouridine2605 synthase
MRSRIAQLHDSVARASKDLSVARNKHGSHRNLAAFRRQARLFHCEAEIVQVLLFHGSQDTRQSMAKNIKPADVERGERIAKIIARSGLCSRRDAERLIAEGRVAWNGEKIASPAVNISPDALITVDGKPIPNAAPPKLWRYHKPAGLVTTHRDPQGRPTVFEKLPARLPRVVSVGRLDINSEGLLLLTNDGAFARQLELPAAGWERKYRARLFGRIAQADLDRLALGTTLDGVRYGPVIADLERARGAYAWASVSLKEGKNREVKRLMESLGCKVARLIRVQFGPFHLGQLEPGLTEEIPPRVWRPLLGMGKKAAGPFTASGADKM